MGYLLLTFYRYLQRPLAYPCPLPSVVIRADRFSTDDDIARIEISANCGIKDLAVLHVHAYHSLIIGDEIIVNHGASFGRFV